MALATGSFGLSGSCKPPLPLSSVSSTLWTWLQLWKSDSISTHGSQGFCIYGLLPAAEQCTLPPISPQHVTDSQAGYISKASTCNPLPKDFSWPLKPRLPTRFSPQTWAGPQLTPPGAALQRLVRVDGKILHLPGPSGAIAEVC